MRVLVGCLLLVLSVVTASCGAKKQRASTTAATPDAGAAGAAEPPIPGFRAEGVAAERARERQFLAVPSAAGIDESIKRLSAQPHMAGTPGAKAVADLLAATLRGLGFDVQIEEYQVYLPHPVAVSVRVAGRHPRQLTMREPPPAGVAADAPELLGWNAYGTAGKVKAPLVYASYGKPEDFRALAEAKVDVRGKLVLLRYGALYRGAQVKAAEERGAAAVIFYADPADEPDRATDTVQRGTTVYYWLYTGDPLTPGRPAKPGVERLTVSQAVVLPKLPVVTITAADAAALVAELPGPTVEVTVALDGVADGETRTIRNVVARLPGRTAQTVILGNHYDAWVMGALDPHSGTAALLEIAKGYAALAKSGWQPTRSIVLAFWDAEEFGVIGSTEWVEEHVEELRANAVAYFNVDTIKAGTLVVLGSHSLRDAVSAAAADVVDPVSGKPFADAWRARQEEAWTKKWKDTAAADRPAFVAGLGDIGIGSDWTAFLHFAGVPSLQWQTAGGPGVYQVWHSARDDYDYARAFADKDFRFTPAFAQVMGLAALRLADADALPFHYSVYADRIDTYVDDLVRARRGLAAPTLDADRLHRAVTRLRDAARRAEEAPYGAALNDVLPAVEQMFLDIGGLVGRPWYHHLLNAANQQNGYASLPLPELAEALDTGEQKRVDRAVGRIEAAIFRAADLLERALAAPR